jgi:hypothetical protein
MNTLTSFLEKINSTPEAIAFQETIAVIDANYNFTPTGFQNGKLFNEANQNNGSCKLFAFALLHQLNPSQTLALFGDFYFKDVLENPSGTDHQNIRNFMIYGSEGIDFKGISLVKKQ